jgi:APA family basic amino acid/polyamine antiporter
MQTRGGKALANLFARKAVVRDEDLAPEHRLKRSLGWPHLVALGVGAIVGAGILALIGVGAAKAGPSVLLSFAIAGIICAAAALAYAEMATMIPASGSAYTYTYVVIGELLAWIIGWSLILEYSLVVSAVSVSWSEFAVPLLRELVHFPDALAAGPHKGGIVNLPAVFIVGVIASLLIAGTRESASLNVALVVLKIVALIVFVVVTIPYFDASHFEPFMPYGFSKHMGVGPDGKPLEVGVMAAAAIIFFAFYGFDAIATAAEETKNPSRDLAIGIVGSMLICVVIYIAVAAAAIGALPYTRFANSGEALALILRELHHPWTARFVAATAVIALPTVILAFFYGQSRIFFVMARDRLIPPGLAKVSGRGSPVRITLFTAVIVGTLAGLVPLDQLAALANAGTLVAFMAVCACMLVMRRRAPDAPRKFRTPLAWPVGIFGILGCAYLFYSLPHTTQIYFVCAHVVGLGIYLAYGMHRSVAGQEKTA